MNGNYAHTQLYYGRYLEDGTTNWEKKPVEARIYFSFAAENQSPAGTYELARMYRDGIGRDPSFTLYHQYLRQTANLGYSAAQKELNGG